jgi:hypothetical protein
MNAKFLSDQNIIKNIHNAKLIAYAFFSSFSLSKPFIETTKYEMIEH